MNVQVWDLDNENETDRKVRFIPSNSGDGSYLVQFQNGGRMMDREDKNEKGNGANMQVWDQAGGATQVFEVIYADGPGKGKLFTGE